MGGDESVYLGAARSPLTPSAASHGAATDGPIDSTNDGPLWHSPHHTRSAAVEYIQAAAFSAEDDPEVHNYLFRSIVSMCHSGHVAISDVKGIYDIAMRSREASLVLYEEDKPRIASTAEVKRMGRYIRKLDTLIASGEAKLESRLKPFPDPCMNKAAHIDQFVPSVFGDDEEESDWQTPDGKYFEINPIFRENRNPKLFMTMGWLTAAHAAAAKRAGLWLDKEGAYRKYGKDDWDQKSYLEVYHETRKEYDARCAWARENIDSDTG